MVNRLILFVFFVLFSAGNNAFAGVVSLGGKVSSGFVSKNTDTHNLSALGAVASGTSTSYIAAGGEDGYYNRENCPSPAILASPIAGVSNSFESCTCPSDYLVITDATKQQGLGTPCVVENESGNYAYKNGAVSKYPYIACRYDLSLQNDDDGDGKADCGCDDGYYFVAATGCVMCEEGYACKNDEKEICSPGTYSKEKAAECTKCDAGYYSTGSGSSSCTMCDAGYYCPEGSSTQTKCPTGACSAKGYDKCEDSGITCPTTYPERSMSCGSKSSNKIWALASSMTCTGTPSGNCYSSGIVCEGCEVCDTNVSGSAYYCYTSLMTTSTIQIYSKTESASRFSQNN